MLLVSDVGQQSDLTCALDSFSQFTLVHCASAGCTTRQDLAAVGHVTSQLCGVFVIDVSALVNAELANLSALTVLGVVLIESHACNLLF